MELIQITSFPTIENIFIITQRTLYERLKNVKKLFITGLMILNRLIFYIIPITIFLNLLSWYFTIKKKKYCISQNFCLHKYFHKKKTLLFTVKSSGNKTK